MKVPGQTFISTLRRKFRFRFRFRDGVAWICRHPRWIRATLTAAGLFCLYLLAGFFLVPGLVRSQATKWVKTNLDKQITLGEIHFNPLTFTLDVNDLAIAGAGVPMVSVGHISVSFAPLSLLVSTYHFKELRLDRPVVRAVIRPDHMFNLAELAPRTHSEGPAPAVRIDDLTIDQGRIFYTDQSQPERPQIVLAPITFTLKNLHTKSDEAGAFTLAAQSQRGERFNWRGDLSIAPIASGGRLTIAGLQAGTIQRFMGARLPVMLTGGQIGMQVDYNFSYGASGVQLDLSLPDLTLTGISLDGKDMLHDTVALDRLNAVIGSVILRFGRNGITELKGAMSRLALAGLRVTPSGQPPAEGIRLQGATLTKANFDYGARTITLGNLSLNGADIYVRRARNGAISLMKMLPAKAAAKSAAAAPPETVSQKKPASPEPDAAQAAWKVALNDFVLSGGTVRLDDRAVTPRAKITISALSASARGVSSDLTRPVVVHVDARVNNSAHVTAGGTVIPASKAGDLKFSLSGLPLPVFVGYMPAMPKLELRSGTASASGRVHFEGSNLAKLRFKGKAAVNRFNLLENSTDSPLFAWRSFSLAAIDYRNKHITVGRARLVRPLARVAVLPDHSFNFTSLMAQKPQATTSSKAGAAQTRRSAGPAASAKKPTPPAAGFLINMHRLDISGGIMGFADYSIDPNFQARIEALQGRISNITNQPGRAAVIDLSGHVIDRYSPVTIKGRMDPFAYDQLTDMQLTFRNIDLPIFNPYSGRYAGYAIAKGKLTAELSYKINHRALQADQHIVIDQLEWGQSTDSKDRVPLPVRLASALLKDRHGVIDLKLPVRGSLDNPTFSVWPVVWQVVDNIIEKAVTAPFQLIGALFEGADKAQFIDFAPGSATLPPGAADALGALAKALAARPVLKLDIPAGPGTAQDAAAIANSRIDRILMADEIKSGEKADVASLDADELHERLEDLYSDKLGKDPEFPEFSPDMLKSVPDAKPDMDDDGRRALLESQWMRDQLRPLFKPTDAELAALGSARAAAIRDALLAGGSVDPARVFLTTAAGATATEGHSRVALKFE